MQDTNHNRPFGFYDNRWGNPVWVWPQVRQYPNNRLCIQLFSYAKDNQFIEPWATATVNLPDQLLNPGEVFIKDYSENAGLLELLVRAKIIEPRPLKEVPSSFITVTAHKLTPEFLDFISETQNAD